MLLEQEGWSAVSAATCPRAAEVRPSGRRGAVAEEVGGEHSRKGDDLPAVRSPHDNHFNTFLC